MEQIDYLERDRNYFAERNAHEVHITVNVGGETRELNAIYEDGEIKGLEEVGRELEELVEEMI